MDKTEKKVEKRYVKELLVNDTPITIIKFYNFNFICKLIFFFVIICINLLSKYFMYV